MADEKDPDFPPVPLWPVWEFDSGFSRLARYVTPVAITAEADPRLKARLSLDEQALERLQFDLVRATRLYELLRAQEIGFDNQPWASAEGTQQIRHPWWILNERYANCLDLTLLYAGMCLAARVGVLLALGEEHAFVVLDLGWLDREEGWGTLADVPGFDQVAGDPGVLQGTGANLTEALGQPDRMALDLVELTKGNPFDAAVKFESTEWQPEEEFHLVDVAFLKALPAGGPSGDFAELPQPSAFRPSIRLRVPGAGTEFRPFNVHERMLAELDGLNGMHALIGDGGRGKSSIARHLAERAKDGAAWFLDASDKASLMGGLAEAMFAEKPRADYESIDNPVERKAMAETAKAYLATTNEPWLVVLDNADGDPATLRGLLPNPKPGQAILVTTITREWVDTADFYPHYLPPVEGPDLGRFGEGELGEMIAGRPLLLASFERLAAASNWDGRELPAPLSAVRPEVVGPAVFWELVKGVDGLDRSAADAAAFIAFLPLGGLPVAVLRKLVSGCAPAIDRFVELGLLTRDRNADEVRLHRLLAEAIRTDVESRDSGLCDRVARRLTTDPEAVEILNERGDLGTVERLERRLVRIDEDTPEANHDIGRCLHGIGFLLELHGHTERSQAALERAERHLRDDPGRFADCLLARARTVNQRGADVTGPEVLEEAMDWSRQARELKFAEGEEGLAYRALAMEGLLMKWKARFAAPGKEQEKVLDESQEIIEESDRRRQALPDDVVPPADKARSRYNLVTGRISKAKASPARAAEHLAIAQQIYEEVEERRNKIYDRMIHPHIAACVNGTAIVAYYRALLLPADDPQRTKLLRKATDRVTEALNQREQLDGSADLNEAAKSSALLAKIALARTTLPPENGSEQADKVADEASGELEDYDLLPPAVPPLPSRREGLRGGIDAWARSQALAELVATYGDPPPEDLELPVLLEWLDDFSERWDTRSGERDVGELSDFPLKQQRTIERSASALGLAGGGVDPRGHYDVVLILGGLARAALSRPRYAAEVIKRNDLVVDKIVAIGAFRAVSDGEVKLFESVADETIEDEYGAMDRGIREAFDLETRPRREEDLRENPHASWVVHQYSTEDGTEVEVVAAPSSEPEKRRANTADTLAWLAANRVRFEDATRVLIVTTDIYVPFQRADAIRTLGLPYDVEIEVAGVIPGIVDRRLAHVFTPDKYLQEIRSAIRAMRQLERELPD